MARAPLLQLDGVTLSHGGAPLLDSVSLAIRPGDRLALVGRNGSGKSTLMKLMAGLVEPDAGSRAVPPGTRIGFMEQEPDLTGLATLGDYAAAGLDPGEEWRVAAAAEGLGFDPAIATATASGGERRRASLARVLAGAPELLLLDEPTNHLDIRAIEWLERELSETRAAFVMISHDRALLRRLARGVLWLDRGELRRRNMGFAGFEDWRDEIWAQEDEARHKLDRRIRAEARWAVEGISARRRRNMGRVRALSALRAERAAQIARPGRAALAFEGGAVPGRKVIEARGLTKSFGARVIVRDFSLRVLRGDRIAFTGANGVGKTTLLQMLTGELAPDAGSVTLGTGLEIAVFDQARARLDPAASLWDSLTLDPQLAVSGASDQVIVRGTARHVAGYLKDFLFDDSRLRAPVSSLSGGEKARLLLARLMARPANLLVLDEPTNDLDVETLDLLQDLLAEFDGTVLMVSHDRDFIDRIATVTVAMEGGGKVSLWPGGWSDAPVPAGAPAAPAPAPAPAARAAPAPPRAAPAAPKPVRGGLSFAERHRLENLPRELERLEGEIAKLEGLLAGPDLFAKDPSRFSAAAGLLAARREALTAAEEEWLELAARA